MSALRGRRGGQPMPAVSALRARSRRRARETSLATVVDSSFRLVIAGSALVVLIVGSLLVWLTAVSSGTVQRYENALAATQSANIALLNQESSLRGFVSTNDMSFVQSYARARGEMELANRQLLRTDGDGTLTGALIDLRLAQQRWLSEWAAKAAAGNAPGAVGSPERTAFLLQGNVLFSQYGDARADAAALITKQLGAARRDQVIAFSLVAASSMVTGLAILFVALGRRRRLHREVLAPVNAVLHGLEAAADGRYDEPVHAEGARELVDVVDGLNRMTARLAEARDA